MKDPRKVASRYTVKELDCVKFIHLWQGKVSFGLVTNRCFVEIPQGVITRIAWVAVTKQGQVISTTPNDVSTQVGGDGIKGLDNSAGALVGKSIGDRVVFTWYVGPPGPQIGAVSSLDERVKRVRRGQVC